MEGQTMKTSNEMVETAQNAIKCSKIESNKTKWNKM